MWHQSVSHLQNSTLPVQISQGQFISSVIWACENFLRLFDGKCLRQLLLL